MPVVCEVCGKKPSYGYNVSHAKNHTPRRWVPNVQVRNIAIGDTVQRVKICTRCLRTMNKNGGMLPR